ncbi:biotin transporter BioY [Flaviflagellibacter deserti]|jgi:biotin transport system substrate-specific component|uniref:Biotin transporter n=1 Tax=Flaviflagellibacter deserti TaxID=2267266 RepID=A0ABV9Z2W2_9HYPH
METRDLVRIALFAAIIGALGLLPKFDLPVAGGVPITLQSLGIMLAGVALGARNGALAVLLFIFLVALGAPILAGGRGGLGVFYGPSAGFILGFVPAAFVAGLVMSRLEDVPIIPAAIIASLIGGIGVMYLFGVPFLAWKADMTFVQALLACMAFVPGDMLKAIAVGFIADAASRAVPKAIAGRG